MLKLKYILSNPISTTCCFIRDSRYKCTFKNFLDQKIYYEKTLVGLTTQKSEFQCKDQERRLSRGAVCKVFALHSGIFIRQLGYRLLRQTKVKNWSHFVKTRNWYIHDENLLYTRSLTHLLLPCILLSFLCKENTSVNVLLYVLQ